MYVFCCWPWGQKCSHPVKEVSSISDVPWGYIKLLFGTYLACAKNITYYCPGCSKSLAIVGSARNLLSCSGTHSKGLSMTLIVNFDCSYFEIIVGEVWKNEQLKFTINVKNKKWLFYPQKFVFDLIYKDFQFFVIFGKKISDFANFFALNSVKRFWIWNMLNNKSKPS